MAQILPVVPLRELVLLPHMVTTLSIGRPRSVAALEAALVADKRLLLVAQRSTITELPAQGDLYDVGVVAQVLQSFRQPEGTWKVLLEAQGRTTLSSVRDDGAYMEAQHEPLYDIAAPAEDPALEAVVRMVRAQVDQVRKLDKKFPPEAALSLETVEEPGQLADLAAAYMLPEAHERQAILELPGVVARLEAVAAALSRLLDQLELEHELHQRVRSKIDKVQREFFLKEKLRTIQAELGDGDERTQELDEYRKAIAKAKLPKPALEAVERELARLARTHGHQAEAGVIRSYLDAVLALPWSKRTRDKSDLAFAQQVLDHEHHGLQEVKDRLLEFLAVRALRESQPTTILCLVGPPGVGKTSLARSVATALGRKFVRVSLGGVRDEAEIRGHRRTYVGAMPGRILTSIKTAGTRNPVFLLDEVDKLSADILHGNPAAALLEVLDPEQNSAFSDHYLEIPFDLSETIFIATANTTAGIPRALLDRLEIIRISGYTEGEKLAIADRHLLPRVNVQHGLKKHPLAPQRPTLEALVRGYTREAGVRQLERRLAALARKVARAVVEGKDIPQLSPEALPVLLGPPPYRPEFVHRAPEVGTVNGLAWTEAGGSVMAIEVAVLRGKGALVLTGQLGDIMKESAQAAYTFVKAHASRFGIREGTWKGLDLHLHVPQGAIPKDGPSAGMAIAVAIASALSGRPVRADLAMTGEVTLRGRVLAVGGIKEKVLVAHQGELKTVLLPAENEADLAEVPAEIVDHLEIRRVSRLEEALAFALLPAQREVSGEEEAGDDACLV